MNCKKCQTPLPEGSKFCRHCGTPVEEKKTRLCEICGAEIDKDARSCWRCETEFKPATIYRTFSAGFNGGDETIHRSNDGSTVQDYGSTPEPRVSASVPPVTPPPVMTPPEAPPVAPPPVYYSAPVPAPVMPPASAKKSKGPLIAVIAVLVILAAGAGTYFGAKALKKDSDTADESVAEKVSRVTTTQAPQYTVADVPTVTGSVPATTAAPPSVVNNEADILLDYINAEREAAGLSSLTLDETLCDSAEVRCEELATQYSLYRPNGQKGADYMIECVGSAGYAYEIIGKGFTNAYNVMYENDNKGVGWMYMSDTSIKESILSSEYTHIGISFDYVNHYWVTHLWGPF